MIDDCKNICNYSVSGQKQITTTPSRRRKTASGHPSLVPLSGIPLKGGILRSGTRRGKTLRGLLAAQVLCPPFFKGDASSQPLADGTQGVMFTLLNFFAQMTLSSNKHSNYSIAKQELNNE